MTRFDLTAENTPYRRIRRLGRWFSLGCLVVGLIGTFFLAGTLDVQHRLGGGENLVALIAAAWITVLFGIAYVLSTPLADACELDERGIQFFRSVHLVWKNEWESPTFLIIDRTQGARDSVSRGKPVWAAAFGRRGFQALLSEAAYRTVLDSAGARGLALTERPGRRPGWLRMVISHPNPSSTGAA